MSMADYDGDGFPDLFVTNDKMPNFLFHNLKDGRFKEVAFESARHWPIPAPKYPAWARISGI